MQKNFISRYESPIGILTMHSNGLSLCRLEVSSVDFECCASNVNLPIFAETKSWLDIYFSGRKPEFTPRLDLCGTDFQKKVWNELLRVDFGSTVTYCEIAKRIGCRSAQAVGQAVGKNPILIIVPCHRVVASGGKLGGFSSGIERKMWLVKNEGFEGFEDSMI